ncbi:MAG: NAD(P)H-dependent oxidoreductase [Paracoccus sp. (in: a-proteobacteria)]|uniref:NAD(P)H-dependent oxidoreductase n=1 Tax=Paracoccus sp. TaxID=267 RepID=UPI0026DF0623|nr:NAD(P)H-dependent oxidoreductase [Paracoccus sp. (in: a-proteobacteria)]MDO5621950.1 NAD(P)H-dependent oxidoreductase [Paracoccus sp. (in: a-proteobacteria)]
MAGLRVLLIDGHPDSGRLTAHLLDIYQAALPEGAEVTRIALRDLTFDPILRRGYAEPQALESDLQALQDAIIAADHLVMAWPMWWGAEPALVKGMIERIFLPGRLFRYRPKSPLWDRLMAGRSADVIVTGDTPAPVLRWLWGNPMERRLCRQVLGFCGFHPLRIHYFATVRRGGAERHMRRWTQRLLRAATSAAGLRRPERIVP